MGLGYNPSSILRARRLPQHRHCRSNEARALAWTVCTCIREGYGISTYDGYGIESIDGEGSAVDDGFSLHRTMVWLRFFCVVGAKSTSSYLNLQGRGNMVLNATTKSNRSCSSRHSRTVPSPKKIAGNSLSMFGDDCVTLQSWRLRV
jgi:hypothetical protein